MRIGLDATAIGKESLGVHNYVYELTKNLIEIDTKNEYVIYCRKAIPKDFKRFGENARFKVSSFGNRKVCEQFWLSLVAPPDNLDVLHNPVWSLPLLYRKKTVLTVHGLGWRFHPDMHDRATMLYLKMATERTVRKATRLIAISGATKDIYVEYFKIPEERIDVVYHGVDLGRFSNDSDKDRIREFKRQYALPPRFILYIGAMFKHKNLTNLFHAFSQLCTKTLFDEVGLVIVGKKSLQYDYLQRLTIALNIKNRVHFTGYFPSEELSDLYNAADLFVFPSLYEGFGLPVLEAFACGTPVITSNTSSLPEVAGGAAILIDPHNPDELTEAMEKVLSDESLRKTMIEKGLKRAKKFSWKETAEKTLKVYEKAIES